MWNNGFEGWYFKHQRGEDTLAFIPGRAKSGAFVQMIDQNGSRQFVVPSLWLENGVIHAGNCRFSLSGAVIDLPGVSGEIQYGPPTPLRSDIMGPFRFFPMECRHGIISMRHSINGTVCMGNTVQCFDGGLGYIEKDSGTSFPTSYLWLQCNDFPASCSFMLSIAQIPFAGIKFTGCICAIIFEGREYRFASYCGVRILSLSRSHICLCQGRLRLEIEISSSADGHPLSSPIGGQMTGTIREVSNAKLRICLWDKQSLVFDLSSPHGVYEAVGIEALRHR